MSGIYLFDDLILDLTNLRKNEGCTPARLRESGTVVDILGGKTLPYRTLKASLVSAICAVPDQRDTDLLLALFALEDAYTYTLLETRQELYGEKIGRSQSTVARREASAIRELALMLISRRYAMSPLPEGVPPLHGSAIHERVEVIVIVRDRLWAETRETFRTIPLINGVEFFEVSSDIPAVITETAGAVANTITTNNGVKHRFTFSKPLKRGRAATLGYTMRPDGSKDGDYLREETRAFHLPTLAFQMEVLFIGEKPRLIWHYSQLPLFERPGVPKRDQLIDIKGGSTTVVEWSDLYGGLYSGIAWEWA